MFDVSSVLACYYLLISIQHKIQLRPTQMSAVVLQNFTGQVRSFELNQCKESVGLFVSLGH